MIKEEVADLLDTINLDSMEEYFQFLPRLVETGTICKETETDFLELIENCLEEEDFIKFFQKYQEVVLANPDAWYDYLEEIGKEVN